MTQVIVISIILLAVLGILIGLLLGVAGKVFYVEVDERVTQVRECLPGNNCGGCGFPGCDGLADAIVAGTAPVNGCPVGGAPVAANIGKIMGVDAGASAKKVAFVKCAGTCDKAKNKYEYVGIPDCRAAAAIPGAGGKACATGCLGLGSCVDVCQFDAIHVGDDGIAKVDREKCVACGKCVDTCPKHLIELIPYKAEKFKTFYMVQCSSTDKGKDVMQVCEAGCIGCGICEKSCNFDAVHVENNIAHIDPEKCRGCGLCSMKCPKKVIIDISTGVAKVAPEKKEPA
ncbi:MAG: RnfABCDGE type electron transport complex subunit B [Eubacterium sp.]|nr:RnfABCDGE type electron transport complex subunit B [Eubacterium sp.]